MRVAHETALLGTAHPAKFGAQRFERVFASILYVLVVILPVVDSVNGYLNDGGNEGSLSVGMAYRLLVVVVCLLSMTRGLIGKPTILWAAAFLLVVVTPHLLDFTKGFSIASIMLKALVPFVIIEAYGKCLLNGDRTVISAMPERLLRAWSVLFPLCVLVPLALGVGFRTYGGEDVGYKGFFYAQNDLCFALAVLFFYAITRFSRKPKASQFAVLCLLGGCILLLGMKSGYILMGLSCVYGMFAVPMSTGRRLVFSALIMLACFGALTVLSDQVSDVFSRWSYFATTSDSALDFFSSGRMERIPLAAEYLAENQNPLWIFFGSGGTYGTVLEPYAMIEMDFVDFFFQFGFLGLLLFVAYYARFPFVVGVTKTPWARVALVMSLLMAFFAGHVLNSALSGMVFSVICCCALAAGAEHGMDMGCSRERIESCE